uniref:Uncharacterized protein n=1 Tax=Xiphophorus couchianus TaxID=32473 RepID=A0A3B5LSJ9_9TELE
MLRGWWARYSTMSGVIPYPSLSMRALHFSSIFMMSRLPDSAQSWRAVFPFTLFRFTSAPRSRRNLRGVVYRGSVFQQRLHHGEVTRCRSRPQRWSPLDSLAVKVDRAPEFNISFTMFEQVVYDL